MTRSELVALQHFLTQFPENLSYSEVLDLIADRSEQILVWQPFENDHPETLIERIESLVSTLRETFLPIPPATLVTLTQVLEALTTTELDRLLTRIDLSDSAYQECLQVVKTAINWGEDL